jgi:hypothetical protein
VHTRLQEVIGTFIYFVRAVDSTMLVALGTLASVQSTGTTQLLNYCATHLDAILPYHTSTTVLHVHTFPNATLALALVASLSSATRLPSPLNLPVPPDAPPPPFNGTIHVHLSIIFVVPSSATEAKLGAYSSMAKKPPCFMTWAIHNQPATPIKTDNACAAGITIRTVKQRQSKAMDMRFHWIRNRVKQGQFFVQWRRRTQDVSQSQPISAGLNNPTIHDS